MEYEETQPPVAEADLAPVRRFTKAVGVGLGLALVPYLWILWGGHLDPLRSYFPGDIFANFYDLQARSLLNGTWAVPTGSLGIEAFVVHGQSYTYFSPFPALLRIPILLYTSKLDGRLTAPSMLVAWIVTGTFTSALLWRVRIMVRGGTAALGRAEAASYGFVVASMMSGSVLIYLASAPFVYNEDFAWGSALAVGSLFALLGVLERPSRRRILLLGVLVLCVNLSRETLGWSCDIGVILAAIWFAIGRRGDDGRARWRSVLYCALIPLAAGCYVTWAKFGYPFGLPMSDQVWSQIDAHRRLFLAANGGKAYSVKFIPSTALAYLRPDGLRLTDVYPFITLPATGPPVVGGVMLDQVYRTGSVSASMPILFLLTIWGAIVAFRRHTAESIKLLRIPLLAAAAGTTGVFVWGYISERYLTDFIPVLFVGSALGIAALWRRFEGRSRLPKLAAAAAIALLSVFGIVANFAMSSTPDDVGAWVGSNIQHYVQVQETVSKYTGDPIAANVERGSRLPSAAPADRLFVLDNCAALYISNGQEFNPWIPVELGPGLQQSFAIVFRHPASSLRQIPLVSIGRNLVSTLQLQFWGSQMRLVFSDPLFPTAGKWTTVKLGRTYRITADADVPLQSLAVSLNGTSVIDTTVSTDEMHVVTDTGADIPALPMQITRIPTAVPSLCRSLNQL